MNGPITLYEPEMKDLRFRKTLLSDPETMSYNRAWGGTVDFPEERWAAWYDRWIAHNDGMRWYRYMENENGAFIGELAYHFDADRGIYLADIIVYAPHRNRGYGSAALDMLCNAAKANGVSVLYDDIAVDNPAISLFYRHGFSEAYRTDAYIMLRKELQSGIQT